MKSRERARLTVYRTGETGVAEQARYRQHVPSDIELLFAKALLSREQGDYLFRLVESKLDWLEQNGVVSDRRELGGRGEPFRSTTPEQGRVILC